MREPREQETHPDARSQGALLTGRFAPSPTGPLHFGSLVTALASYADARSRGGRWLLRIEDIDPPRCMRGAADDILRTLERVGLEWDGEVLYQSRRLSAYQEALERLNRMGVIFPCACSRKEQGDRPYDGTCRNGLPAGRPVRSWRLRVPTGEVRVVDRVHGAFT